MNDPTDPTEDLLARLIPAAPSARLMDRLRAARPSRGSGANLSGSAVPIRIIKSPSRRWLIGLGAAAAVVFAGPSIVRLGTSHSRLRSAAAVSTAAVPAVEPLPPSAAPQDPPDQIFLPVESTRQLVSLQPARVIQRPDEAPQRFMRAVWIDDVTAVGAETDAALHLRRTHEAFVPVTSPIY